jgi:nitroreductase
MEFWDVIESRRSIRDFDSERDVSAEDVEKLLKAALLAPTAGDRQPWHFSVIRDPKTKRAIARFALRQQFIANAPVMIVISGEPERSGARWGQIMADLHTVQDTSAAAMNILLAATDLGLASCWVSAFRENEIREVLELSDSFLPLVIIPIGYPVKPPGKRPSRRSIEEVTKYIE